MSYKIPDSTRIGHVHLKVSDLDRALSFYKDLLGFEITQRYGTQAVFISAGAYHHHIGLNIPGILKALHQLPCMLQACFTPQFYILSVKISPRF